MSTDPPARHARHQGPGVRLRPRSASARAATTRCSWTSASFERSGRRCSGRHRSGRGARRRQRSRGAARPRRSRQRRGHHAAWRLRARARAATRQGRFDGVLGLGGGGGTTMITAGDADACRSACPKLMVSTMASGNTAPYVDVKDITLMYSVVDIAGLNPLSRRILANAAGAICGMVEQASTRRRRTADCRSPAARRHDVRRHHAVRDRGARARSKRAGYDVLVFHATGSGGRAMEGLIDDGYFAGVMDVTTTEWCDEVVGGVLTAGPIGCRRGRSARGIPQVVSVGALDMVNFGGIETVPERFRDRNLYTHNATVTLMRTTAGRMRRDRPPHRRAAEPRDGPDGARAAAARRQRDRRARASRSTIREADRALFETPADARRPRRTSGSSTSTRTSTIRRSPRPIAARMLELAWTPTSDEGHGGHMPFIGRDDRAGAGCARGSPRASRSSAPGRARASRPSLPSAAAST